MKTISKEKSKLIDRTEVIVEITHLGKATPSMDEIKKEICKEFKSNEDLVIIKLIDTKFGEGRSFVSFYIYDNLEELKKLEKYEKPKEVVEKKEEAPKEEVKEQPKEEVKEEIKENGKEEKTEEQSPK